MTRDEILTERLRLAYRYAELVPAIRAAGQSVDALTAESRALLARDRELELAMAKLPPLEAP